jgi:hydrogenase nickel incorporation protein HypA/HybF
MHELSIAISMIEMASAQAARLGGAQIEAIHLRLGPLAGVVKEALLFSYEIACQDTPLAGSRLVIEEAPVIIFCHQCQRQEPLLSLENFACPQCHTPSSDIIQGRELEIIALEIAE